MNPPTGSPPLRPLPDNEAKKGKKKEKVKREGWCEIL
jgi:hypothetical protein